MLDNKIIISYGGIVLLAPAAPFLFTCAVGAAALVGGAYAFYKLMEND